MFREKTFKLQGIAAVIAVIVMIFAFITCDNGNSTKTYNVFLDINGGSGGITNHQTVKAGESITLPSGSGLSCTGYTFGGWNTNADGTGTNYSGGSSYTVTGDITLYARWVVTSYTVTFNANGGSGTVPAAQSVRAGYFISLPSGNGLVKDFAIFSCWNTNASGTGTNYGPGGYDYNSSLVVTGDITLYAKWEAVAGFENKLIWLGGYAQSDTSYTIEVDSDESLDYGYGFPNNSGVTITLVGVNANRTISFSSYGCFGVYSGVTLILDNNITLRGNINNSYSVVEVSSGGTLIMNTGSTISDNGAGGVFVDGTFIMNGGSISGNTARDSGGGVYVNGGTFTMNGGSITGNSGGGVWVARGTFAMNGGSISGNTAQYSGGGVYVVGDTYINGNLTEGTFTMKGGTISGNTAQDSGGGVYVQGTFTKTGGTIYGYDANDTVNSNVVKDGTVVIDNKGHAVFAAGALFSAGNVGNGFKCKKTTAGPNTDLYFCNSDSTFSGEWDDLVSVPTGVSASAVSSSSIMVSWNELSDIEGYYVYRSSSASGTYTRVGTSSATSYTDTGLSENTTYYYKVSAYNSDGESPQSAYTSAKTPPTSIPSTPTGVSASAAPSNSITVRWTAVSNADGYYVYRSSSASGTYTRVGTSSTTSYTDTGLSMNTTYYYKVSAYNVLGESSQSSYASETTLFSTGFSGGYYLYTRANGYNFDYYYIFNTNGTCTYNSPDSSRSGTYTISGSSIDGSIDVRWTSPSSGSVTFRRIDNNTLEIDVYIGQNLIGTNQYRRL